MATIEITLPDELARIAASAGLFTPEATEVMVRNTLRAKAGAELRAIRERLKADPLPAMSEAEIQLEVDAVRAEKRRAAVIDTNIVVSGLLWAGIPGRLIDAAQESQVDLITSPALLAELWSVVSRRKFDFQLLQRGLTARVVFDSYAGLAVVVQPAEVERIVTRDPADDEVLAAALAGGADLIVTGDAHLLDLGRYRDIAVVRASEAVARIAGERTSA